MVDVGNAGCERRAEPAERRGHTARLTSQPPTPPVKRRRSPQERLLCGPQVGTGPVLPGPQLRVLPAQRGQLLLQALGTEGRAARSELLRWSRQRPLLAGTSPDARARSVLLPSPRSRLKGLQRPILDTPQPPPPPSSHEWTLRRDFRSEGL